MRAKKNITGIILAGGKSSRMGTDKGLLLYQDEPFIQYSIKALQPIVGEIIIVANNPAYDVFKGMRVSDIIENAGPLSGVYTGLKHSNTSYNLVLSCDIPLIKTKVLEKITDHIDEQHDIIQVTSNGITMPLIAFYNKRCEEKLFALLNKGERRMKTLTKSLIVKNIELTPEWRHYTANINTPEELKSIIYEY